MQSFGRKINFLALSSAVLTAFFSSGCGSSSDVTQNGGSNVTIPEVTFVCKKSTAETCNNKDVLGFYATDTCTTANMNAGKYVAQAGQVPGGTECDSTNCTTKFAEWFPVGSSRSGTRITTISPSTYRLCVFVDTNGNRAWGDSGDYVAELTGVVVNSSTAAQTVSGFSAIP